MSNEAEVEREQTLISLKLLLKYNVEELEKAKPFSEEQYETTIKIQACVHKIQLLILNVKAVEKES